MAARGVNIRTGTSITHVEKTKLYVRKASQDNKDDQDEPVPYGLLLWVTGNTAVPLIQAIREAVRLPEKGLQRVITDARLHVLRPNDGGAREDVYALGDVADIDGDPLPTTAEVAVQKAEYLVRVLNGTSPSTTAPFKYRSKGLVTYIGGRDGIAAGHAAEGALSGSRAWLIWRGGSFSWTRSWRNRIMIAVTWSMNLVFGKDVTRI